MTPSPIRDLVTGLFVLAGLAAITYLSVTLGGFSIGARTSMQLVATFDEVGRLTDRSQVVIGGVKVGEVESIALDDDLRARVTLSVDPSLTLSDDTSASILTSGLLGDQFVSLQPGGSDELLQSGDEIAYTESAIVIERLIGRAVDNLGGGS